MDKTAGSSRAALLTAALVLAAYAAQGRLASHWSARLLAEGLGLAMVTLGLQQTGGPHWPTARSWRSLRAAIIVGGPILAGWWLLRATLLGATAVTWPAVHWRVFGALGAAAWQHVMAIALPEELFWRGYLQATLAKAWPDPPARPWLASPAVWVSCAGFALSHVVGGGSGVRLATLFPGLVFAWSWRRYGVLSGPWALHASFNLVALLAERLLPAPQVGAYSSALTNCYRLTGHLVRRCGL